MFFKRKVKEEILGIKDELDDMWRRIRNLERENKMRIKEEAKD